MLHGPLPRAGSLCSMVLSLTLAQEQAACAAWFSCSSSHLLINLDEVINPLKDTSCLTRVYERSLLQDTVGITPGYERNAKETLPD